jgi:hypothetical protein
VEAQGRHQTATAVLPSEQDEREVDHAPDGEAIADDRRRRTVVGWAAVATTGVVVVTIAIAMMGAVRDGWQPVGDEGAIAVRSYDTLSSNPPLLGASTTLSVAAGDAVSHPGPLQFWLLAPFVQVFGPQGVLIGTSLINMAWVVAIVAVAWRQAGPWFTLLSATFVAVLASALGGQMLRDPYNPWTAVLPMVLCAFLCWSAISGVRWGLPALVAVASVAAQAHVSFLLVAVALVVAAMVAVVARAVRDRRRLDGDDWRRERRGVAWSIGASAVVGLICWSGPLIDQFARTGNLGKLLAANGSGNEHLGYNYAKVRLLEMFQWPPDWLDRPGTHFWYHLSAWDYTTSLATLAGLVALGVWGYRTGERRLARLVVVAVVALAASFYTTSRIVVEGAAYLNVSNRLNLFSSAMVAWLALVWGISLVARRAWRGDRPALLSSWVAPVLAVAAVVLAVALVPRALNDAGVADDPQSGYMGPVVYFADVIADQPGNGPYVIDEGNIFVEAAVEAGLIAQLEARGVEVHIPDHLLYRFGWGRKVTGDEIGTIVLNTGPRGAEAGPGVEPLAVFDQADPPEGYERYDGYTRAMFADEAVRTSLVIVPAD